MSPELERFYQYFNLRGRERLDGMDESIISSLRESEKREAYDYLEKQLARGRGVELVHLLNRLDSEKAIGTFSALLNKGALEPMAEIHAAHYVYRATQNPDLIGRFTRHFNDQSEEIRSAAIQQLPADQPTHAVVDAIRSVILNDPVEFARDRAIEKLIKLHGIKYESDPNSVSARYFCALSFAENADTKVATIKELDDQFPLKIRR